MTINIESGIEIGNGITITGGAGGGSPVSANLVLEYLPSSYNGSFWVNTQGTDAWGVQTGGVTFSATGANIVQTPSVPPFTPPINTQFINIQSVENVTNFTGTTDYTVEVWLNASSVNGVVGASQFILGKQPNSGLSYNCPYFIDMHSNTVGIATYDNGAGINAQTTIVYDVWYQITGVFSWSTDTLYVYRNGVLQDTGDLSVITPTVGNNSFVRIGAQEFNNNNFNRFAGGIGIVRMYNSALTGSEVLQNFNANRNIFGI